MFAAIKKYLNRAIQRRRSYVAGRRGTLYEISHDANHMNVSWLTMENERGDRSVMWKTVISIKAFKRDLYVVDRICLGVQLMDGSGIEVHEEMKGWDALVQKLPEYLPGCKTFGEWFETVAFPAFQLNETSVFEKVTSPDPGRYVGLRD